MNYREKMREYLKEPSISKSAIGYGKWCALNPEQRQMIRKLLDEMDKADNYIKELYEEKLKLEEELKYLKEKIKNDMEYKL